MHYCSYKHSILLVFTGTTCLTFLRGLRRGYRHCFAVILFDTQCVIFDPLSHQTFLEYSVQADPIQLARGYQRLGFTVITTDILSAPPRLAPLRPYTCVEAVKRVLGMHLPKVFTPWQLFRVLAGVERKKFLDTVHACAYSAQRNSSKASAPTEIVTGHPCVRSAVSMGGFVADFISPPKPPRQSTMSLPVPHPQVTAPSNLEQQIRDEATRRRQRGKLGTIKTSHRGLLSLSDWAPQRKSLLGE